MSESALLIPNTLPPSPYEPALLPWEDVTSFQALRTGYHDTFTPAGPAEVHLVEQIVWCDWRRRRLLLGERALHMASLQSRTDKDENDALTRRANILHGGKPDISSQRAIRTDPETDAPDAEDAAEDLAMTEAAIAILEVRGKDAYAQALAALREDTREWWENELEEDERYKAETESLLGFLLVRARPVIQRTGADIALRPEIRLQAWGESLDPQRMDRLLQLDERLTRQYEKLLGMLGRMQQRPARLPSVKQARL